MKKIPFDLQKALAGAKIVARDGSEPEQWFYFDKAVKDGYKIICVFEGRLFLYDDNGKELDYFFKDADSDKDLFLAVETVTKWINVVKVSGNNYVGGNFLYDTQEEAKEYVKRHDKPYTQTIPVEIEL